MGKDTLKVGVLARRTGLTVRTLHYYEEKGLLKPSIRTESGHRLYGQSDVERLQKILSLRHLGFSLEEIGGVLDDPDYSLEQIIYKHLAHVGEMIRTHERLYRTLEHLAQVLRQTGTASVEELINLQKVMTMTEKYYTPEQQEYLKQRREEIGEDAIRKGTDDWTQLIAEFKAEMEKGTDPSSDTVQQLVDRQQALVEAFTGGNPGIRESLTRMYREEGAVKASRGAMDADVAAYMARASEVRRS